MKIWKGKKVKFEAGINQPSDFGSARFNCPPSVKIEGIEPQLYANGRLVTLDLPVEGQVQVASLQKYEDIRFKHTAWILYLYEGGEAWHVSEEEAARLLGQYAR